MKKWQSLQMNGGVVGGRETLRLSLPVILEGYSNAQIYDYHGRIRSAYPWSVGTRMKCRARFSHQAGELIGTAGFGFWNAPFADPTVRWPALPQAVWFFYGSPPTDLPLANNQPGQGWFAATLDAGRVQALALSPLAPCVLLLNQSRLLRERIWPLVQRYLGISYYSLPVAMKEWHSYELVWHKHQCQFLIDNIVMMETPFSPRGPLGFVCWIDNQYMVAQATGRLRWGTLPIPQPQWLEVDYLQVEQAENALGYRIDQF